MTTEEIEKRYKEFVETIQLFEKISMMEEDSYPVHMDRLKRLRALFEAVTELRGYQIAEEATNSIPEDPLLIDDHKTEIVKAPDSEGAE